MVSKIISGVFQNFLGNSPEWYKFSIIGMLILNPIVILTFGYTVAGWVLIAEFIFTLALALKAYPLAAGGLLAIESILLDLTSPSSVYAEVEANLQVILLLVFMVAGIYFMKDMLLQVFSKILLNVRNKILLSLTFSFSAALLSAFLDALTVTAVLISVAVGFYGIYHKVASGKGFDSEEYHDHCNDCTIHHSNKDILEEFRGFLRSLLMHGAVGTALGGVCTLVGEPQNLLIADKAGWNFVEFFTLMAPVTMPVLVSGLILVVFLEGVKPFGRIFGYGDELPEEVYIELSKYSNHQNSKYTFNDKVKFWVQVLAAFLLVIALGFHLAAVGLIGLGIIIFLITFNGIVEEHQIGKAFEEALPFTALLVVFFVIVSVIHDQHLFTPIISWVLTQDPSVQPGYFFIANGFLSAISDNVFVATVYINEVKAALDSGQITREHFDMLAIAINTGTNLPSVATPNGQAAFLFLLTSAIAPLIRLSYYRMFVMAIPYTIVMSLVGYFALVSM